LIHGNEEENVTGIDSAWEEANVFDGAAWFDSHTHLHNGIQSVIPKIVDLNSVIRKLADNLEQTLADQGYGNHSIIFEGCDFKYPVHATYWDVHDDQLPAVGAYIVDSNDWYTIREDLPITLHFDPDGKPGNYNVMSTHYNPIEYGIPFPANQDTMDYFQKTIWINYHPVKIFDDDHTNEINKISRGDISSFQWERIDNFIDLLRLLAINLRANIEFMNINATTLKVKFTKTSTSGTDRVTFKSIGKDQETISSEKQSDKPVYFGEAFSHAKEGHEAYWNTVGSPWNPKKHLEYQRPENSINLLLTVSPTVGIYESPRAMPSDSNVFYFKLNKYNEPHCVIPDADYSENGHSRFLYRGYHHEFTTAMFVFVPKDTTDPNISFRCNDYYWTPVAALNLTALNGGETLFSQKLSEIINEENQAVKDSQTELFDRKISSFNWYGYAEDESGSNPDIKNINIGALTDLDRRTYSIESYT
jgi:hypothetical protein